MKWICLLTMVVFAAGCSSYRFTTTLPSSAKPVFLKDEVRFRIASAKFTSKAELPSGISGLVPGQITDDEARVILKDTAVQLYPGVFSEARTALPINVVVERTAFQSPASLVACLSCLTLTIVPVPDTECTDYVVKVESAEAAFKDDLQGATSFTRVDTGWLSLFPTAMVPVPGPSHVRRIVDTGGDKAKKASRQLTLQSCVEAVVQVIRQSDKDRLDAAFNQYRNKVLQSKTGTGDATGSVAVPVTPK